MKFEHTQVMNVKNALRGMRNPLESWGKADSAFWIDGTFELGENDLELMQRLIKAGGEHRKFLRQIFVSVDITAPAYWFSEFDTYKIGTTANSTSKMHKLASRPIDLNCFETDDYHSDIINSFNLNTPIVGIEGGDASFVEIVVVGFLEELRKKYLETKDKRYWKELVRWLPESWLQTRTITMNYENVYNMVHQRYNHKLNEWSGKDDPSKPNFIGWARTLPYAKELLFWDLEKDGDEK